MVVEEVITEWCGEIVAVDRDLGILTLEDRRGRRRTFPLGPGLPARGPAGGADRARDRARRPAAPGVRRRARWRCAGQRARVARESRIFVEGRHDAELVEKVWGDDLRVEGVVVEHLGGVDDLLEQLRDFGPGPDRRVGVLVDHLVPGSKESRIADDVRRSPVGAHVLVVGHPFVDVWAGGQAGAARAQAWPDVPRDIEWKHGICEALGWPHADQADIARAWQQILARVASYADCEPALLGRVEELIDFVTAA